MAGGGDETLRHHIGIENEGAALVAIDDAGRVEVDWAVEWLTVAPAASTVLAKAKPVSLPLLDLIGTAA